MGMAHFPPVSAARPLNQSALAQNGCHATLQSIDAQQCLGWSELVTRAGNNSPFCSQKKGGIMQTGQAVTIGEHLHRRCCGKLGRKDANC